MIEKTPQHLSDRDLLLIAGDEVSPRPHGRAEPHLRQCQSCESRLSELERELADASALTKVALPLPPSGAARSRLRMQLVALRGEPGRSIAGISRVRAFGAAAAVAVLGIAWLLEARSTPSRLAIFLLPRADLTPGAVRPVAMHEICDDARVAGIEPVPAALQRRIFASYGADVRESSQYELDYLITPELGGAPDPRNLWPQPFTHTQWNAFVKDELELHLHNLVCEGQLELPIAQQDIAHDWIAAYKRHFRTDRPRRDYATSPLTPGDSALLRAELQERGLPISADADGIDMLAALRSSDLEVSADRWFVRSQ
jgi:hypothetical protein